MVLMRVLRFCVYRTAYAVHVLLLKHVHLKHISAKGEECFKYGEKIKTDSRSELRDKPIQLTSNCQHGCKK